MYLPSHFRREARPDLYRLIRQFPLATLVTTSSAGLCANHVPLLLSVAEDDGVTLRGHVARANTLVRDLDQPVSAMAIFTGPDSYISPSWYPAKAEHGKVVPTWNYTAVHASGRLRLVEDPQWLAKLLDDLTAQQEGDAADPWSVDDAPQVFIQRLSSAIVGIELAVETLEGKWKVSQNQSADTRVAVADGLRERGRGADAAMAELVMALED
ncbi:FMN-binding negative transcriptional regulator [Microbulbifer hainanensis]|uniref:FMN-binding negative transcriptional regulator n=1 Tax=Microbulbifer hainanensis TaxID=2735675 RepID=UPI00186935F7|nr:FMN-binding negative transcriptional regulator [Microbulbifer hainanensis]